MKNTGQYQESISGRNNGIAKPDDLAAIQVTPNSPDWILAKVITHDPNTQMYKLADEDIESNKSKCWIQSPMHMFQTIFLGMRVAGREIQHMYSALEDIHRASDAYNRNSGRSNQPL